MKVTISETCGILVDMLNDTTTPAELRVKCVECLTHLTVVRAQMDHESEKMETMRQQAIPKPSVASVVPAAAIPNLKLHK